MIVVVALIMGAITMLDVRRERAASLEELREQGLVMAGTLTDVLADALHSGDTRELNALVRAVGAQTDVLYVRVFAPDDRLIVNMEPGAQGQGGGDGGSGLVAVDGRQSVLLQEGNRIDVAEPIVMGDNFLGSIELGLSNIGSDPDITALVVRRGWQFIAFVALGILVSLMAAQYLTEPIRRLVRATRALGDGELTFSTEEKRSDELGELTRTFAEMTERLQDSRVKIRERTHELKDANEQLTLEISERRRAEVALEKARDELEIRVQQRTEELRSSEEETTRLAEENSVMAEIGRIVTSSLHIDDVYAPFAQQVRTLMPFDELNINVIDAEQELYTTAYHVGPKRPGYPPEGWSLGSTFAETVARSRSAILFQTEDYEEVADRFPGLTLAFEAGLRSFIAAPLISGDRVIATLHVNSVRPDIYSEREVRLAERVGAQIAGAISNAQLHVDLERDTRERQALAEIGRIITSSLDIDDVYGRFAERVRDLVHFDRINVNLVDLRTGSYRIAYHEGIDVPGREVGATVPLAGTFTGQVASRRTGTILVIEDVEELGTRLPGVVQAIHAGVKSALGVPLVSRDTVLGVLVLNSCSDIYTDRDLILAERVADQIAGAIANSQLFALHDEAEKQLLQAQKMEAIGRLAGGIAHDFNNLLTAIMGYSQLELMARASDGRFHSNLEEIQKAASRAADLTRQLLTFSRRQIIEPRVFDLNDLILNMDKMLRRLIGEDIELVTLAGPRLGPVKVDPGQMEQVLMNLAVNARDAMPQGGSLVVETSNATDLPDELLPLGKRPEGYVVLRVSDTGTGMTEEVRSHAFEPFFTTKGVGEGTGLGLSTCYGIVAQSGGHIGAESEPGQGTTFRIYLPRVEAEEALVVAQDASSPLPGGTETVLLAEDEPSVREMAGNVLRDRGYTVLEAANGVEAPENRRKALRRADSPSADRRRYAADGRC